MRETARKAAEEARRTEREMRMCYWGYKFEQLCTCEPDGDGHAGGYRVPSPGDPGSYDHLYPPAPLARLRAEHEHACSGDELHSGPGSAVVDANEEFCTVVSVGLDKLKVIHNYLFDVSTSSRTGELVREHVLQVLVCAEIDAVESFGGKDRYVELKTSKLIRTPRDRVSFERARPCSISARIRHRPRSSPTVSIPLF